jgi:4-hydroxy-tetrahydrodipicolinate reductase
VLFEAIAGHAARLLARHPEFGAWLHEVHHDKKLDAPSGTALGIQAAMEAAGYGRTIDVASSRAGHVPGIHTVGFDGPSETITLSHSVRDRGTFARGALLAARWVKGRQGWFTMRDVLGLGV